MVQNTVPRRRTPFIQDDLQSKMVLLAGPRQCGKTSLAEALAERDGRYYSWDNPSDRSRLRKGEVDLDKKLWVFDELHKYRGWRNWLKGIYDVHHQRHQMLVTGSARLDLYGRGGDSMAGRYFMHHLHPFTCGELLNTKLPDDGSEWLSNLRTMPQVQGSHSVDALYEMSGFPEPFLKQSARHRARWQMNYMHTVVREDIANLEAIQDLDKVEMLFERCADGVGSPLSINSLREDVEASFSAVKSWMLALERVYAFFRIPPFGPPRIRAVKKEQKLYYFDWTRIENSAARWENIVACHLATFVSFANDIWGEKWTLSYFRSPLGHEVDFVLLKNSKPLVAIEVKTSHQETDRGLRLLSEKIPGVLAIQTYAQGPDRTRVDTSGTQGIFHVPIHRLLPALV